MILTVFAIWSLMKRMIAARAGQFDAIAAGGGNDTGGRFAA